MDKFIKQDENNKIEDDISVREKETDLINIEGSPDGDLSSLDKSNLKDDLKKKDETDTIASGSESYDQHMS